MFGVYLNRKDSYTMKPKGWVSDMVGIKNAEGLISGTSYLSYNSEKYI